jgi:hypothetical protein
MHPVRDKFSYASEARGIMNNTRFEMRRRLYPGERRRVESLIARVEFEAAMEAAKRNIGRRRHSFPQLYRAQWVAS